MGIPSMSLLVVLEVCIQEVPCLQRQTTDSRLSSLGATRLRIVITWNMFQLVVNLHGLCKSGYKTTGPVSLTRFSRLHDHFAKCAHTVLAFRAVLREHQSCRHSASVGLRHFQEQGCPNQFVHFISLWQSNCS